MFNAGLMSLYFTYTDHCVKNDAHTQNNKCKNTLYPLFFQTCKNGRNQTKNF